MALEHGGKYVTGNDEALTAKIDALRKGGKTFTEIGRELSAPAAGDAAEQQ